MKRVKVIISAILIVFILSIVLTGNVYATSTLTADTGEETKWIALSKIYKDNWSYKNLHDMRVNDVRVYGSKTSGDEIKGIAAYCLTADLSYTWNEDNEYNGFAGIESERVGYNNFYDLENEKGKILDDALFSEHVTVSQLINGGYYNQIVWILDNIYIPGVSTDNEKDELFEAARLEKFYWEDKGYPGDMPDICKLTDSDIEVVNQLALWYYTNFKLEYNGIDAPKDDTNAPKKYDKYDKNNDENSTTFLKYAIANNNILSDYNDLKDDNIEGGSSRNEQARILFEYLIDEANNKANNKAEKYKVGKPIEMNPETYTKDDNGNKVIPGKKVSNIITVGPIKLNKFDTNTKYEIGLDVKDQRKSSILYKIIDSNGKEKSNIKELEGNEFYITVDANDVTELNLDFNFSYDKKTLWLPGYSMSDNPLEEQPIVIVEKVEENIELYSVPIEKLGEYEVVLVKEDATGKQLDSTAVFEVNGEAKSVKGKLTIAKVNINEENVNNEDKYIIKELVAPDEYCEFDGTITLTVTKKFDGEKYVVDTYTYIVKDAQGKDITNIKNKEVNVYLNEEGNLYVEVKNYQFDLKLLKYITAVNDKELSSTDIRNITIDSSNLKNRTKTTANYKLPKDPVLVEYGDLITYTIRIYNEGEIDGYASEISENVPSDLVFVKNNEINKKYGWVLGEDGVVRTTYLARTEDEKHLLKAFNEQEDDENGSGLSSDYVQIVFKVSENANLKNIIRNEAAISEDEDKEGRIVDDRDSDTEKWYKKDSTEYYDDNNKWAKYEEDDEDYDNLKLKIYDLSLRKFIIQVENKEYFVKDENGNITYTRQPNVDTKNLYKKDSDGKYISTTAIYNHTKEPLFAQVGNKVVYVIRVYNEGQVDAFAGEIVDYLPNNLEYVEESEINKKYGWAYDAESRKVITTYLSKVASDDNILESFDGEELDYKDVQIECLVKDTAEVGKYLTNIAEITEYENKDGFIVNPDYDSTSNNLVYPEDSTSYKNDEIGKNDYIPGQEDDDDFEKVLVSKFDLALRKYITKVTDKEVNTRNPQITYEDGTIKYTHPKDPVLVSKGDIVEYTLVVFNEGTLDGYASEITDYILNNKGLIYLNGHETNEKYGWKMYDEEGNETEDVSKAVSIKTDYLSKDKETSEGDNLLKAFNKENEISDNNPDRKYLKVAYKVADTTVSKDILVNIAEISDDSDKDGDDIDDIDSTPGKDKKDYPNKGYDTEDHEDDIDYEPVIVTEFDLALKKFVTQAIVIENGNETITETGHTGNENPEPVVKVELDRKKLSDITVKFNYTIRIINEGDIDGYAKEITDYIPEGLKFVAEDNPGWIDEGNNVISTRLLENTLLKPGETADVKVLLTWISDKDNVGLKTNTAEISEDYNEKGVKDKDSTPDNKVPGEDDIDDAPVILAIKTGSEQTYYILAFVVCVTIAGGILLIKKYVLE